MELMKYDMTGGATVMGAMRAIAQLKPPIPVFRSSTLHRKSAFRKSDEARRRRQGNDRKRRSKSSTRMLKEGSYWLTPSLMQRSWGQRGL